MESLVARRAYRGAAAALGLAVAITCADPVSAPGPSKDATDSGANPTVPAESISVSAYRIAASISVGLGSSSIKVGDSTQANATIRDKFGRVLWGRRVTWSSNNVGIAPVDSRGMVKGSTSGSARIIARYNSVSGSAAINVASASTPAPTPPPSAPAKVASVAVTLGASAIDPGKTTNVVVMVKDSNNNILTDRAVTLTSSNTAVATVDGATKVVTGVASGTANVVATSEGVSGQAAITVNASAPAPPPPPPSPTPAGPSKLTVSQQPSSSVVNGVAFAQQPKVQLMDSAGAAVAKSGVVVNAAIASGGGALSGTTSATTDASGVAAFSGLTITGTTGARTLSFSSTSLTSATSGTVTVTAGAATQLSIATQPSASVTSGIALAAQPVVRLRDVSNNLVSKAGVIVTVAITSGGGTLGGTTTATTDANGAATYSNLAITGTAGTRTLGFSAPGLTSATSQGINVQVSAPAGGGIIASSDFNGGSGGAFSALGSIPSNVTYPDDPTGSGRGKVAQFRFNGTGHNQDLNLALNYQPTPGAYGLGSTFYFRGDLYFPSSTANFSAGNVQRKLLYFRREGGDPRYTFAVLHMFGSNLNVEYSLDGSDSPNGFVASINPGQWYRIEMQVTMNSSMGSQDGVMRVWIDGALKYEKTGVRFTNPGWSGDVSWKYWWFGMQRESMELIGGPQEPSIDEVRYWDNVVYSTSRNP